MCVCVCVIYFLFEQFHFTIIHCIYAIKHKKWSIFKCYFSEEHIAQIDPTVFEYVICGSQNQRANH